MKDEFDLDEFEYEMTILRMMWEKCNYNIGPLTARAVLNDIFELIEECKRWRSLVHALEDVREGRVKTFDTIDELLADLEVPEGDDDET